MIALVAAVAIAASSAPTHAVHTSRELKCGPSSCVWAVEYYREGMPNYVERNWYEESAEHAKWRLCQRNRACPGGYDEKGEFQGGCLAVLVYCPEEPAR